MILILFSIFLLTAPTHAFFRHLCFNPLGFGRIDPVVSPGKSSHHVHHLFGSGTLGINSIDADMLLEANCTSCSITLDKSGYWAPAMYFKHENGTFDLMSTSGGITVYYKTERRVNFEDQNYTAFPKGFRMVAGDTNRREWVGPWPIREQSLWTSDDIAQPALASKALGFNCLNYHRGWDEATFAYPWLREKSYIDTNCLQGVRAEILFPSCWDGVNLDSPNHNSHVAYPTLLQDGACPKTHPVFLPILFYETIWNTQDFIGIPGEFVFANGDPTGYGYHADFLAAWQDGILEQVMNDPNCTDQDINHRHTDGLQEHCPVFNGHIQSQAEAAQCKLEVPEKLIKEKIVSQLDVLPGNVKVTGVRHDPWVKVGNNIPADAPPIISNFTAPPHRSSYPVTGPLPRVSSASGPAPPVPSNSKSGGSNVTTPITTIPSSAVESMASIVSTSTFVSNGVYYEMDVVLAYATVTSYMTPNRTATTTKYGRKHHTHGRVHGDAI